MSPSILSFTMIHRGRREIKQASCMHCWPSVCSPLTLTEPGCKMLTWTAGEPANTPGCRTQLRGRGVGRAPRELETHGHRQTGFCFQDFAALFFCLFGPFCLILGMASPADLFLIRHHLWVSRGGPQPCSFGSSPGNNSDSVQGPLCKILTYGRIFLQIFILL